MYKFVLYYEQKAPYQDRVKSIAETLDKIRGVWKADSSVVMVETRANGG